MQLEDILEVKSVINEDDANILLSRGWRLLNVATEKLVEEKQEGHKAVSILEFLYTDESPIVVRREYQQTTYVLGRYK